MEVWPGLNIQPRPHLLAQAGSLLLVAKLHIGNQENRSVRKATSMDISSYSPAVRELLAGDRLAELGPGRPNEPMREKLTALTVDRLLGEQPIRSRESAAACLAGLWLYHDFLDESHKI